jgi:3-deoxy-D-manno-octulosonic-acid transferase
LRALRWGFAANATSLERLRQLGLDGNLSELSGNTKYDRALSQPVTENPQENNHNLAGTPRRVIFASVHPDDWGSIAQAVMRCASRGDVSVVLAPRHPEKVAWFEDKLQSMKILYILRSQEVTRDRTESEHQGDSQKVVLLLDTLGELSSFYEPGSLVCLGGTFFPLGGHNPLEAAAAGSVVVVGPHVHKIRDEILALKQAEGLIQVESDQVLETVLNKTLDSSAELLGTGARAKSAALSFQGAAGRVCTRLQQLEIL